MLLTSLMKPTLTSERRWTVRAFLLTLVLACLLPGVLGASALLAWQYRQNQVQLEQTTVLTARAMMQSVDYHLLRVLAVAQALSTSDVLIAGDLGRFYAEASATLVEVGLGSTIVVRDEAGRQLLNTLVPWGQPIPAAPAPEQVEQVFTTGQPVISDIFMGPVLRKPVMAVNVPVRANGRVRYALAVGILPEHFNALLSAQQLPPQWVAAIMDRTGTLAGRSRDPEQHVGRLAHASLLALLAQQPEGAAEAYTVDGRPVIVFYSRSPVTGWATAIGIPREAISKVFVQTSSLLTLGVAGLFALGALLAWGIGGHIARAFSLLAEAAGQLGRGGQVAAQSLPIQEASEALASLAIAAGLLGERNRTLQEADRRKDEFIAILAHELRNPLAPVRTAVEILRRTQGAEARQVAARDVIERQVAHMARLIDDLLDVSRIAQGKLALHRERCDFAAIARQTAEDYRASFEDAGLRLEVAAGGPLWVDGDPVRLAQMVGNLLNNAQRFTERGGWVRVVAQAAAGQAQVQVQDNGVGISPELQARLFDPFSQADQDLARSKGGLGLGLALTRGLAQLHGGSVAVHSEGPGQGSRFTLCVPLAADGQAAPADELPPTAQAGRRVLVIEDNEDAAHTLADLLTLTGHEVRVALTGEAGLDAAREFRPDAVISDLGLPGRLDGYAVGRALRADPALRQVRLVALSGYADPRSRERSREAGFDVHLAKPTDLAALEAALAGSG